VALDLRHSILIDFITLHYTRILEVTPSDEYKHWQASHDTTHTSLSLCPVTGSSDVSCCWRRFFFFFFFLDLTTQQFPQ